jgi:SRSO17 transposase
MMPQEIAEVRPRLAGFAAEMLGDLPRKDQRATGELYARGLLTDGRRKSMQPMAARLGADHQRLQQFITSSTWDYAVVRRNVARWFAGSQPVDAVVIDDTGFPKDGQASPCVARQYSGTLGKTGSCQVAVSLHHAGEQGNAVLGWRLYLPETWTKDKERRQAAGIPEEVVFKKKWELALDLIDQVRGWRVPDRIVLADAGYGEATEFRKALEERGLRYAVGISPQVGVWSKAPRIEVPAYSGRGAPPKKWDYGKQRPGSVKDLALKARGWKKVRWRAGSKGWLESRFLAVRAYPSHGFVHGDPLHKEIWLLVEWPEEEKEPTEYFFCDLPASYTLRRLVRITKCRWKIEQDYHQLKEELGLDHYEGRNWNGWHHHVTLVMLAYSFLTLETLRSKKNFWVDPAEDAA